MNTIKIGADELILWLRKNGNKLPNENLGRKIHDLIIELGGVMIEENYPSHWANQSGDKNVDRFDLPKTAAQYKIFTNELKELYDELSNW